MRVSLVRPEPKPSVIRPRASHLNDVTVIFRAIRTRHHMRRCGHGEPLTRKQARNHCQPRIVLCASIQVHQRATATAIILVTLRRSPTRVRLMRRKPTGPILILTPVIHDDPPGLLWNPAPDQHWLSFSFHHSFTPTHPMGRGYHLLNTHRVSAATGPLWSLRTPRPRPIV